MNKKITMNITIENYRGYEIFFDTSDETFFSVIDESKKQKKSFASVKKVIDEYIKENSTFVPFKVQLIRSYSAMVDETATVTGIRKDRRFIAVNGKGENFQISDYNEGDWILEDSSNEMHFAKIAVLDSQIDELRRQMGQEKEKIKRTTLKDIKSKYTAHL